ncbi:hypothetical protein [Streptomyces sp. TR02-1]|uniref:hypothetical protein n=1 Tax=Streptomyces sp. TR02-1 TaxID=3385977 RepID=UPI0039A38D81
MSTRAVEPERRTALRAASSVVRATLSRLVPRRGWQSARWVPFARALAYTVAILCVMVLATAGTLRSTVLERGFYQGVLDDERAYDRLYDEVLVDPEARPVTQGLLASLPVPEAVVTANLKIVLPPVTVRELTGGQIDSVLGYLRGESDTLSVSVDLKPVLANVDQLAQVYLGGLVSGRPEERSDADLAATLARIDAALDRVAAGERPADLPHVELSEPAARKATQVLLSGVPDRERATLRPQVSRALEVGDVATALAVVGPHLPGSRVEDRSEQGKRDLVRLTEGGSWDVVRDLRGAGVDLRALDSARDAVSLAMGPAQTLSVLLGVLSVVFLWLSGPPGRTRRLRAVGWIIGAGGALSALLFAALGWWADELVWRAPASWPPSLAALVEDLEGNGLHTLADAGVVAAGTPLLVGAVLAGGCSLWARRRNPRPLPIRRRTAVLVGSAVLTTSAVVLGVALAPAAARDTDPEYCNGSAALCDLRYDQGAYLATHNSMSTTADRFISPLHDGNITSQLDNGARALLLDTHTWERPDEITRRLKLSEFGPGMQQRITDAVGRTGPTRPGLWLCHAVCRGGASPLVGTLRTIGDWMAEHPREVVTLIVQDGITGEQTRSAFERAGLKHLLYTPDDDPRAPWPTLGEMVEANDRLVVFAEREDGPARWYRNFYRYGMETPYAFSSPEEMNCLPNRGGTGKRLFLMNHFVTDGGGSRIEAARVNARDFVLRRARRCRAERGRPVNFVAVDFASLGNAKAAVDALNAARAR